MEFRLAAVRRLLAGVSMAEERAGWMSAATCRIAGSLSFAWRPATLCLATGSVLPGLAHRSDRGSQYTSSDYTDLLKTCRIQIGMKRKCHPWDSAICKLFMKWLEIEAVLRKEDLDLTTARAAIREFQEKSTTRSACTRLSAAGLAACSER